MYTFIQQELVKLIKNGSRYITKMLFLNILFKEKKY